MSTDRVAIRDVSKFLPEKNTQGELLSFYSKTTDAAASIIKQVFPSKILSITTMIIEKDEYKTFFETLKADTSSKRAKTDKNSSNNNSTATFEKATEEFDLLKDEVLSLVESTSTIKLWLQLNVPRIEDGNNFGVSIQNDTVSELSRVEDGALMTVENWSKFLLLRAKVISKIAKHHEHPEVVHSYCETLEALDEKQLRAVWIGWVDLRNHYAISYDLIMKNIEKLVNPRTCNTDNMY